MAKKRRQSIDIEAAPEEEYKSRSQRKREVIALQKIGERLVQLSPEQVRQIDMPPDLLEAVLFAKTITKHGAKRRQMQHIGVLMRGIDPEPIQEGLAVLDQAHYLTVRRQKEAASWRDRLSDGDDALVEEIISNFDQVDRQHLRSLIRNTQKEKAKQSPPKSARLLYRYLLMLLETQDNKDDE